MKKYIFFLLTGLAAQASFAQFTPYTSASNEVTLIITHGQSLSIGLSVNSPAVSAAAEYPQNALTLQTGNAAKNSIGWSAVPVNPAAITNFAPYFQSSVYNESPGSGMLSAILASFDRQGITKPTLLHIHGGAGGRSVSELMIRGAASPSGSDYYPDTATALASANLKEGDPFVVIDPATSKFLYYVKRNGAAVTAMVGNSAATQRPVYYNNIMEQVKRAVSIAQSKGMSINRDVYFVWIQGQNDTGNKYYQPLLTELLRRIEVDLQGVTGLNSNMRFHAMLSQLRGTGDKDRSIDMLQVANDLPQAHFAAQESWISNAFGTNQGLGTHLYKVGYRVLGEQIGNAIVDVMKNGTESFGAISDVNINGKVITVTFGGLRGQLVDDPSIHVAMGHPIPPNYGCTLFTTSGAALGANFNSIVSSQIINGNQVQFTLANNVSGSLYLYFGRSRVLLDPTQPGSMFAGTTLRDSVQDPFVGNSLAPTTMIGQSIPRFIPIQRVLLNGTQASYKAYTGILSPEP